MTNPTTAQSAAEEATPRPWHTPLSLRFDDLPLGRASIWDAKGYSLIFNARRDVAQEFV